MPRSIAARILLVALIGGVITDIVGPGNAAGLNVAILVTGFVAAAHLLAGRDGLRRLDPADAWLAPAAVLAGAMAALRADPSLVGLDTLAGATFAMGSVACLGGARITRGLVPAILGAMVATVAAGCIGAAETMAAARRRPPAQPAPEPGPGTGTAHVDLLGGTTTRRQRLHRAAPVLRGLVLAVPLVVVFGLLFSSADAVFARFVGGLVGWRFDVDFGDLFARAAVVSIVAWGSAGVLALGAAVVPYITLMQRAATPVAVAPGWGPMLPETGDRAAAPSGRLGTVEATTVLALLDAMFAAFVALQVTYLFGGHDTLAASGMTYAEYARRGFFELVVVAALAGTVVVALDLAVGRRSRVQLGGAIVLLALTGLVLASALLRLRLYQDAYGWTELRLVVLVAIGWLAAAVVMTAALLATRRTRWAAHGLGALALVALVGLNAVGPQAFVAERNLERAADPSLVAPGGRTGLDGDYLATLGDEAVPPALAFIDRLDARDRAAVGAFLSERARTLATDPFTSGWPSWNLGRERARTALAAWAVRGTADGDGPREALAGALLPHP